MPNAPHYHQQAAMADLMSRELHKGMMTTITGRVIDSGPDWVMIQQDRLVEPPLEDHVLDVDFAALERRIYDFECFGFNEAPAIRYLDLFTPVEPSLPQEVIDSRPKPMTILMEINRVSYAGDSEQAEPWRGRVRTARDPIDPVRGRGPRRERW